MADWARVRDCSDFARFSSFSFGFGWIGCCAVVVGTVEKDQPILCVKESTNSEGIFF